MSRRLSYVVVAVVAAAPRLVILAVERGKITSAFLDKGDTFARTFVASGTYGFVPGHPSAYTQPLYGFFLIPLYWIFGRHWEVVGLAQTLVAVGTAVLVYEIGRRVISPAAGLIGAVVTTLHPYLVWHDVHMNREILDQFLAAAVVLLTVVVAARPSLRVSALLGVALGLAILGNVRLAALPVLLALFIVWQAGPTRRVLGVVCVTFALTALTVAPWLIRNRTSVGCFAVTTDARALWKANNLNTYRVLTHGGWIDNVPNIPGAPLTPQDSWALWMKTGHYTPVNECAQMTYYSHRTHAFWLHHFGAKVRLAFLSAQMLWQPSVVETSGRPNAGTFIDRLRTSSEPAYVIPLYVLGVIGLLFVPRAFAVLAIALAAYQTATAMIFVGVTRYRVPWDFLICVLASATVLALVRRVAGVREARRLRLET